MARLLVFCESPTDFETVKGLVDRVLREQGPEWARELLEGPPEAAQGFREWVPDGEGREYFDLHKLSVYARRHKLRVPQGHFAGQPGEARPTHGLVAIPSANLPRLSSLGDGLPLPTGGFPITLRAHSGPLFPHPACSVTLTGLTTEHSMGCNPGDRYPHPVPLPEGEGYLGEGWVG